MLMAVACAESVHHQDDMECPVEARRQLLEPMQEQRVHRWGMPPTTTCKDGPTTDLARNHRERRTADVDGERICPKCSASNAERWAISPTCVPIQRFQAIAVALSAGLEVKHDNNEIDHVHTSSASPVYSTYTIPYHSRLCPAHLYVNFYTTAQRLGNHHDLLLLQHWIAVKQLSVYESEMPHE